MAGELLVRPEYRWTTQDGRVLRPSIMATSHLFNTVVMIWHHRMPESMRLYGYYKRYSFGKSDEELMTAIAAMIPELATRTLTPRQDIILKRMMKMLRDHPELTTQRRLEK